MICIYHSRDLDGFASGAIVKRKYPEAVLIGYDYGQPFPWDKISPEEDVIMIDVSLPMEDMLKLARHIEGNFTWIDHHISAINDYNRFLVEDEKQHGHFLTPVLENGIAACELGWKHLFPNEEMPQGIRLLGEYDTWRNQDKIKWDQWILPYQFGMRIICDHPDRFPWDHVWTPRSVQEIRDQGVTVLEYQGQVNAGQCKNASFEFDFRGHRAICLNGGMFNSDVFKSVFDPEKHDIMMPFQFKGKFWQVSVYTTKDDVDCSAISKQMGGGGHKKAAGFQVDHIEEVFPFMRKEFLPE
jgi:oligoribonuclease NrnB/cAMP/cGMP phosphodiesterase (DHH superfamily)